METIALADALRHAPPIAVEAGLLELFSPTCLSHPAASILPRSEHAPLWRADAIHRAKNMAQLTISLANIAERPSRRWLSPEVTTQARRLSHAYDELGVDDESKARFPCSPLLTEIATRLADLFGRSRGVSVVISADAVLLPSDLRRALLLMASELVINALKYGYPTEAGGTISVSLVARDGKVELVVEDDGIGNVDTYSAGHGGGLLHQLSLVLGATATRTSGVEGHGFRVSICVPIVMPHGDDA
ncbi:sensor histidine kinase [Sphingomonas koreensis]|nr:sensor histidine kinase [Sphingomonas koreensis]